MCKMTKLMIVLYFLMAIFYVEVSYAQKAIKKNLEVIATCGLHNSTGSFTPIARSRNVSIFHYGFFNVAVDNKTHQVFINQPGTPQIHVLDGNRIVRRPTLSMPFNCAAIAFDQQRSILWASVGSDRKGDQDCYYAVQVFPMTGEVERPLLLYNQMYYPNYNFIGIGVDEKEGTIFVSATDKDFIIAAGSTGTVGKIAVDQGPSGIVVDSETRKAFVVNYFANSVSIIDIDRMAEMKRISVGMNPFSIALDSSRHIAFVASKSGKAIHLIDTRSATLRDALVLEGEPGGVGAREKDGTFFVSIRNKNAIDSYNIMNLDRLQSASVGPNPGAVGVDQATGTVFVLNEGDGKADRTVSALR
jgi:YVTN family beta-propeller protein